MNPAHKRKWWLRKRLAIALLAIFWLGTAVSVAVYKSGTSKIIIYNETGQTIGAIKVTACGQETVFTNLDEEESCRWKLARHGFGGEISLETTADSLLHWQGGHIESHGGYRIIITLMPNGEVELQTQISAWQRLLNEVFAEGNPT